MGDQMKGKVAIVTGSGQGIGKAIAEHMAEEGARVVVNGRDPEKIRGVVAEIESKGGVALGVAADVTRRPEVHGLIETTLNTYGQVDILVNNAVARRRAASFFELTDEEKN